MKYVSKLCDVRSNKRCATILLHIACINNEENAIEKSYIKIVEMLILQKFKCIGWFPLTDFFFCNRHKTDAVLRTQFESALGYNFISPHLSGDFGTEHFLTSTIYIVLIISSRCTWKSLPLINSKSSETIFQTLKSSKKVSSQTTST